MKTMIPPKPAEATWTDDQWKAIMAKGKDILVAAAAGSGKTAVLVERIINKILDENEPLNVDELLVVTFTNASAAEMRHRIGEALEKAITADPASIHLRKQISTLNKASISTLHSFCLDTIRKNYYEIDIDPGFRIADETEAQLLRDEVLEELFEDEYGKEGNEQFFELVDIYSNDRSDTGLQDIIRHLYDFAMANPSPESYLNSIVDMYSMEEDAVIEDLPFTHFLLQDIELQLNGAKKMLEQALKLAKEPGGPAPLAENFIDDIQVVDMLIAAKNDSWATLYEAMNSWKFGRAKTVKGDEYDAALVDQAKKLRDKTKKILQDLQNELFSRRPESFLKDIREMKHHMELLTYLVKQFEERFTLVKAEKGIVDFADLEHYCLRILAVKDEAGRLQPSNAALAYRKQFKEVLVDEYQDTNMVQEAILQLVTKDSEQEGNLFMVGDVKQSIYRFRLAEPNLFLTKYNRFLSAGEGSGLRIDLARNFRSRKEVLDGTNYIFKQIMGEKVGEIEYDEDAELVNGAPYPTDEEHPIEVALIDMESGGDEPTETEEDGFDQAELAQSQVEARYMAAKIKDLIENRKEVYNPKLKANRPAMYRDIVILLRSMTWAPQIMEEFKQQGIPVYANLSSGYFEATEVSIMMSLLKVIDNPYQDIPLAAVLRSPIVRLTEGELAKIRIHHKKGSFYEALTAICLQKPAGELEELYEKAAPFLEKLTGWRTMARQGSLSDLVWHLYRETRFYDFVGGMPGGKQRQANLRALYDRARQYEATSFRGLFRFLRFIDRMRDRGDDLGAARALGEQEDVVRIMTIHSSKGLEFPFVFIAGLARNFNTMDLKKSYLFDKDYGFAAKYVHAEKRITYPSLPQLALKRKKKMEMLAEEMRVLYVALTRAKEKLYLIGSVKNAEKKIKVWQQAASVGDWLLSEYDRAAALGYMDWIAPAIVRHRDSGPLKHVDAVSEELLKHPSSWKIDVINQSEVVILWENETDEGDSFLDDVYAKRRVPIQSPYKEQLQAQLDWTYEYKEAAQHRSKQSVSEIKRQKEIFAAEESGIELVRKLSKPIFNRPKFMQEKKLSPAERGTAMHMLMQHIDLRTKPTIQSIHVLIDDLVQRELLTAEQSDGIDPEQILPFFDSDIAQRMQQARNIYREVPFSLALPASEVYPNWDASDENVIVQGIVDCLFEDEEGLVLVDYKSDAVDGRFPGGQEQAITELSKRYETQLNLYTTAIEHIWNRKVNERYLYLFDGRFTIKL